jgi:hypothetical protein
MKKTQHFTANQHKEKKPKKAAKFLRPSAQ